MRCAHRRILQAFLSMVICAAGLISCTGRSEEQRAGMPAEAGGEAIKIGVCMPATGPWSELSRLQLLGIRMAAGFLEGGMGRSVELVFRDTGGSPRAFAETVRKLLGDDGVSGIISCASAEEEAAARPMLAVKPVPFVVTSPCGAAGKVKEAPYGVRICVPHEDRAYACARFLSGVLKVVRIGLVVDGEDPSVVLAASVFSAEMIRMHGRIVDIAYLQKNQEPDASIARLLRAGPDAVYIPSPGDHLADVLKMVRSVNADKPVLIAPLTGEELLLDKAGKMLDGVYIQTDFIGQVVRSETGKKFIEYFRRHAGRKTSLGSGAAGGAEGYSLMLDMVSEMHRSSLEDALQSVASRNGSLMAFTGVTPSGAVYPQLLFGRVHQRFLGGATVTFVAAITLNRSDPVADVVTQ